jgi:deoxyribodipyrimidine photo-lyase
LHLRVVYRQFVAKVLVWFRNDLRITDHQPLFSASRSSTLVIPLYCLDPRHFGSTSYGFPKTGVWRAKFLLESLQDLRENLRSIGSDLLVRVGYPELIIPELCQELVITAIYFHGEVTSEELTVETKLQRNLAPSIEVHKFDWGQTLYHLNDLPFNLENLPELFTNFRKQVEKYAQVRAVLPTPKLSPVPPSLPVGIIPNLQDLGIREMSVDPRQAISFTGGETAGKQRLDYYFWQSDRLQYYKQTRNQMLGADYSSKFSPWLAHGCLSPRYIYSQIQQYEQERIANDSTYWLVFELLWRDYFRFICAKHGNKIFQPAGLQGIAIPWSDDRELFERWRSGTTGYPLVDANMRELHLTGFMSNRGRQNVASFLTKNLGIDWRMGAEWFESCLIDYDVCSNYGNWNYTAGVGNDARGFRFFNINKQAQDYDPTGEYVRHWLPELQLVPTSKIHQPWQLSPVEQARANLTMGKNYPLPIVDLFTSAQANQIIYDRAVRPRSNKQ